VEGKYVEGIVTSLMQYICVFILDLYAKKLSKDISLVILFL
jgi:hypothetical protein